VEGGRAPGAGRPLETFDNGGERLPVSEVPPEAGGARSGDGEASSMVIGTWSDLVEGREVSHPLKKGRSRGFANAKSIKEGRAFPERGNLVYTPGDLRRAKPPTAACSKYGVEEEIS